jgi:hypothetical protein
LSDSDLRRELRDSRERISQELDRPCRFVAYPFGESDDRVHSAAAEAGYIGGFVLQLPPRRPPSRHSVPRAGIYRHDGMARFVLKTSLPWRRRGVG